MGKTFHHFLILIGVLVVVAPAGLGQNRNSITGFVFDDTRRPVGQIYVELQTDLYTTIGRVRTAGSGMYSFRDLPSGQYNVRVLNSGTEFEEQIRSVSLVPISPVGGGSLSEQVDFYLKRKKVRDSQRPGAPGVVFAQEIPAEAKALYDGGVEDLANKNEAGLTKIKRSIEVFPDYYFALDRLGVEYLTRGHYEAAFVLFTKAVMVNPRSFSSTFGLGVAEFRLGQTDRAVNSFTGALKLDKSSINGQLWLGKALHKKQDLVGALKALIEADKLSGGSEPEVHWQLARVYKDQSKFADAANELEIFLRLRPDAQDAENIKQIIVSLRQKGGGATVAPKKPVT